MQQDVVVVGSGAGGLTAALAASRGGARVKVIEKAPVLGGTTAISGGGMWVPANRFQAEQGIEDSAEAARGYLHEITKGRASPAVLDSYVTHAPIALEFLEHETEVSLYIDGRPDYLRGILPGAGIGRTVLPDTYDTNRLGDLGELMRRPIDPGGTPPIRWDHELYLTNDGEGWGQIAREYREAGITGRGGALVGSLLEACANSGVEFLVDSPAMELVIEGGAVVGVIADMGGQPVTLRADQGVVLASGGFEWNREMWQDLVGAPLDFPVSPPFNEGDGLRMAMKAGARVANMRNAFWATGIHVPGETMDGAPRVRLEGYTSSWPGAIAVNQKGRRFVGEQAVGGRLPYAMTSVDSYSLESPNYPAFAVFDEEFFRKYPIMINDSRPNSDHDWVSTGPTLREVAEQLGIDHEGLDDEVRLYNQYAERGEDPLHRGEFGWGTFSADKKTLRPLGPGPYYGIRLQASCWGTKGGPVINENGQVINYADEPINGLFAAGNVTAWIFGPAPYPGGGSSIGPAVTFGMLAGLTATGQHRAK